MPFIEFEKSIKDKDWSMLELHSHQHYEIYFLSKGTRTILFSDSLYKISAPSLIIIPPNFVHKTEGSSFERYNINVTKNYLNAFQLNVLEEKKIKVHKLSTLESKTILNLLNNAYSLKSEDKYYSFKQNAIFSALILEFEKLGSSVIAPQTSTQKSLPTSILKILDYMAINCDKNFTLDKISSKFFISKNTLIYNFNKHVGRSPMDYLLTVRLNKAKQLLAVTLKSISKISEECGFSSANYFGLIFKKKTGVSPLEYRKIQKNKL